MECKTARLFQAFAAELGPDEAEELNAHLATCGECDAAARAERRLDAHMGRAMRDVPVPAGLRGRIGEALAAGRARALREAAMRWLRPLTAAAAVLLITGLACRLLMQGPRVEAEHVQMSQNLQRPGDADEADAALGRIGFAACAPRFVKYSHLTQAPTRGELPGYPGRQVPVMNFADGARRATVYVIDTRRTPVKDIEEVADGYPYRAFLDADHHSRWAYLILYTGGEWADWLKE